jgi:hypothetical protein
MVMMRIATLPRVILPAIAAFGILAGVKDDLLGGYRFAQHHIVTVKVRHRGRRVCWSIGLDDEGGRRMEGGCPGHISVASRAPNYEKSGKDKSRELQGPRRFRNQELVLSITEPFIYVRGSRCNQFVSLPGPKVLRRPTTNCEVNVCFCRACACT